MSAPKIASRIDEAARERRLDMQHLQAIEGNPLEPEEIAMFEMFEREGWSFERRRAHIAALFERPAARRNERRSPRTGTSSWA